MVKFRNSGTKGAVVKSRVDITLTFKELQDNVLLDDIFAGGRAFGTGVSFSVGNTHTIIIGGTATEAVVAAEKFAEILSPMIISKDFPESNHFTLK